MLQDLWNDIQALSLSQTMASWLGMTAGIILRYYMLVYPLHHALWDDNDNKNDEKATWKRRLTLREPTKETIQHEMNLSNMSAIIYALPATIAYELWNQKGQTRLYSSLPRSVGEWMYLPLSALIYLIIQDTHFYWTHRWMHQNHTLYRWVHHGHHKSIQPTPWASFSFDALEAVSAAWLLPATTLVVPVHLAVAITLLMFMSVVAIFNHSGHEIFPQTWIDGWFGHIMITASHHNLHHTHYTCNYGLYFRFWDQLCGTDGGLQRPVTNSPSKKVP